MSDFEILYSTSYQPDTSDALAVLAFLLVPDEAFFNDRDTAADRAAIVDLLDSAKRDALVAWYASYLARTPTPDTDGSPDRGR